jgi:hypothetical protein
MNENDFPYLTVKSSFCSFCFLSVECLTKTFQSNVIERLAGFLLNDIHRECGDIFSLLSLSWSLGTSILASPSNFHLEKLESGKFSLCETLFSLPRLLPVDSILEALISISRTLPPQTGDVDPSLRQLGQSIAFQRHNQVSLKPGNRTLPSIIRKAASSLPKDLTVSHHPQICSSPPYIYPEHDAVPHLVAFATAAAPTLIYAHGISSSKRGVQDVRS